MSIERRTSNIERGASDSVFDMAASIEAAPGRARPLPDGPSRLYGAVLWQAGLALARTASRPGAQTMVSNSALLYGRLFRRRSTVVVENLLPALGGDRRRAGYLAEELFRNFGRKLVDLWRFEAGLPVDDLFAELTGWEHFLAARKTGRGVLLVTPHLGNWEFGAPLLAKHGMKLHVITLAEPGRGLTEMRQAARARWGIETVVIGRDPFAFVEIIRLLESGATVALLVDRPPKTSAIAVRLFGRGFAASIAAAELARATHCEILPVYLPCANGRYAAHVLPAVGYERAALRERDARQQLTQAIISLFEAPIRAHLDQWYHFVPVWNENRA